MLLGKRMPWEHCTQQIWESKQGLCWAQGLPLSLSGVRRIMEGMDWGDALQFVAFGNVRIHKPFLSLPAEEGCAWRYIAS